jgi:hypothetical protein
VLHLQRLISLLWSMTMQRPWNTSPLRLHKPQPCVTFSALAWLKLQYFCHAGPTEIGGFGISAEKDLLYVEDFITIKQHVSPVTVHFDDAAVADFFDHCVDCGLRVDRFARLWCHTHPAASVAPSVTDEDTFARSFGRCDWAVMFILGRTGRTSARLKFTAGPGAQMEIVATVDWSRWPICFTAQHKSLETHVAEWQQEYITNIHQLPEPGGPFARLLAKQPSKEGAPWPQDNCCPEIDLVTYEPVEDYRNHDHDPRPPAS